MITKEMMHDKILEIKTDCKNYIALHGKLPHRFNLLPSELKIVEEALKHGYDLLIIYEGKRVRIPITKETWGY